MDEGAQVEEAVEPEATTEDLNEAPMELSNESEEKEGVIKVSNISPQANVEQMKKLFGFLGNIQELVLYPKGFVFLFAC